MDTFSPQPMQGFFNSCFMKFIQKQFALIYIYVNINLQYINIEENEKRNRQGLQLCEAQKATCIASCPLDRVFTTLPDSQCKWRCEAVNCN